MHNFLIQESAFSAAPVIEKKNPNTVEFIAVLQEADKPNRNGRIYYKRVLEEALQSPYVQERLRTNSFYSEAGHPTDTSVQRQMTIDQRNIACIIKEFWWEGNLLKARIETANTSIGRDMKGLIEQGSRVAFSLRAQGNVHHDNQLNATIVESPIQIATYDWVVNPSHDKAFLENICEDTRCSMFGVKESKSLVLAESVKLYESGRMIALNEITKPIVHDYAKNFWKKVKPLAEAYIHNPKDKLVVAEKVATVQNDNVTKKVVLEDFLLKDIRHRILKLTEEGEAAAQPVATSEAPAKEHTPEVKQAEVHAGEQKAEEVKAPIIESKKIEAASKPVHDEKKPAEHTPVVKNADVQKSQSSDTLKAPIIESKKPELSDADKKTLVKDASKEQLEKLIDATGSTQKKIVNPGVVDKRPVKIKEEAEAAAQPVATSDAKPAEHTPEVKQVEVHVGEQKAEEVKAPIIESRKLPDALKKNTFDDPKDADKVPEKLEKKALKEEGEAAAQPVATSEVKPAEHTPEVKQAEVHAGEQKAEEVKAPIIESKHAGEKHDKKEEHKKEEKHSLKEDEKTEVEVKPGEVEVELPAEEKKEETVEVKTDAEPELMVSDSSIKIEIPLAGSEVAEVGADEMEGLKEAFRTVHSILSGKRINEDETVEVPAGTEAEVKVEGDKLVVEIPVESPKEVVPEGDAEKLAEAVSAIAFILRK
jgi:hypothetical protein